MRKRIRKLIFAFTAAVFVPVCLCPAGMTVLAADTAISISGPSTVKKGQSITLSANKKGVSWRSNDETVAKVTSAGNVTGVNAGSCIIIASKGNSYTKKTITVTASVGSVNVSEHSMTLTEGSGKLVAYSVSPSDASASGMVWRSSNTSVAKVDSTGYVTAVAPGEATITVKVAGKTATCNVTVTKQPVTISFEQDKIVIQPGTEERINNSVISGSLTVVSRKWSSSNTGVATVTSDGLVKGRSKGYALVVETVTVRDANGAERTSKKSIDVYVSNTIKKSNGTKTAVSDTKNVITPSNKGEAQEKGGTTSITPGANKGKKTVISGSGGSKAVIDENGKLTYYDGNGKVISEAEARKLGLPSSVKARLLQTSNDNANLVFSPNDYGKLKAPVSLKDGTWSAIKNGVIEILKNGNYKIISSGVGYIIYEGTDANGNHVKYIYTIYSSLHPATVLGTMQKGDMTFYIGQEGNIRCPEFQNVSKNAKTYTLRFGQFGQFKTKNKVADDASWSTSNNSVIRIGGDGTYIAVGIGKAAVTVQDEKASYTYNIEVKDRSKEALTLTDDSKTYTYALRQGFLDAGLKPGQKASWASSEPRILEVDKNTGEFTTWQSGNVYITVKIGKQTKKYFCRVYDRTELDIDRYNPQTSNGAHVDLTKVRWTGTNSQALNVFGHGYFHAYHKGTGILTVSDGKKAYSYKFRVIESKKKYSKLNSASLPAKVYAATSSPIARIIAVLTIVIFTSLAIYLIRQEMKKEENQSRSKRKGKKLKKYKRSKKRKHKNNRTAR